jgi:Sec-independent protein translocase protein TatA
LRKPRRKATDEPDEDDEDDGEHHGRAVPSSDTKSASEFELAGYGEMVDTIAKLVKDQIAQEIERLADNCLNNAIKQKLSQFHQQKTDVKAELDKSRWLFGRTMEHADKVESEMGAAMYDFKKEMKTMMQGFEEEQRASIDSLETKLEAHQTKELKEMQSQVLQTILDGDECTVVFTFSDEAGLPNEAAT